MTPQEKAKELVEKPMKQEITEEYLIANGWQRRIFFYAIGGGEDENDDDIWVKDGVALIYEWTYKAWFKANEDDLSYVNGFPYDDSVYYVEDL